MGREHRLQADAQLRQARDRRAAGVFAALPATLSRVAVGRRDTIVGIDVGENFLDLAIIAPRAARLEYERLDLRELTGRDPLQTLILALRARVPTLTRGAIAIVDSPRVPRDVDCRNGAMRTAAPAGRNIDAALRRIVAELHTDAPARRWRLSMFPTPKLEEFSAFVDAIGCKPHLAAIGRQLFDGIRGDRRVAKLPRGRLFTRFMLAGFATHVALESLGVRTFEGYPFLAFSLWKGPRTVLPPKSDRNALRVRTAILGGLSSAAQVSIGAPSSLDQADAASLALSVAACTKSRGRLIAIADPAEGRFIAPLNR